MKTKRYFHINDNANLKPRDHADYDPLFKVRPLLTLFNNNLKTIPPEERQAIDKQIIPFKGRRFLKQYNKNKSYKWGFKVFIPEDPALVMYQFDIYTGRKQTENLSCPIGVSVQVVLDLSESREGNYHKVYFDNWFSSVKLSEELLRKGIYCVGTIRSNGMQKFPLAAENDLKKERGSFDYRVEPNRNVSLVSWKDKVVNFVSTYCDVNHIGKGHRWDGRQKKHVEIDMPKVLILWEVLTLLTC